MAFYFGARFHHQPGEVVAVYLSTLNANPTYTRKAPMIRFLQLHLSASNISSEEERRGFMRVSSNLCGRQFWDKFVPTNELKPTSKNRKFIRYIYFLEWWFCRFRVWTAFGGFFKGWEKPREAKPIQTSLKIERRTLSPTLPLIVVLGILFETKLWYFRTFLQTTWSQFNQFTSDSHKQPYTLT